jgi:hypothetical protein
MQLSHGINLHVSTFESQQIFAKRLMKNMTVKSVNFRGDCHLRCALRLKWACISLHCAAQVGTSSAQVRLRGLARFDAALAAVCGKQQGRQNRRSTAKVYRSTKKLHASLFK